MKQKTKIEAFLREELAREHRQEHPLFISLKSRAQEFFWTLSRIFGFSHWHDGRWRAPDAQQAAALRSDLFGDIPAPALTRRLFIDMTATHRYQKHTGVQRVVREIARVCVMSGSAIPIFIENGRIFSHFRHENLPDEFDLSSGDRFFLLDSGWGSWQEYLNLVVQARAAEVKLIGCLYDIIPLLYPDAVEEANCAAFHQWFAHVLSQCDALICISKSVALDYLAYLQEMPIQDLRTRQLGWFPLGADFETKNILAPTPVVEEFITKNQSFFLSVGTIEPRKAYPIALAAFETLWAQGDARIYVIVGRAGWNTVALQKAIKSHAEYGRRLYWFADANDADLRLFYQHAQALVFPSFAEGFGMPLVEALYYGASVIASDIPVFREVGGDDVRYFSLLDADSLQKEILATDQMVKKKGRPRLISWQESASHLVDMINHDSYQINQSQWAGHFSRQDLSEEGRIKN
ncbi:MAG: glycosyltransferase family 4 protein [Alphaproteobacteria bacterium]|nr:glycosyltransferase family 4 protein [Alphaproteobacteria bacterium]